MTLLPGHLGAYPDANSFQAEWSELAARAGGRASVCGTSFEGRAIHRYDFGAARGPAVMLTGLIHGVEYIGALALFDFVRDLVERRGTSGELLRDARVVVVPVVNPDGLHANSARLARGQRAFRRGNARGVDLNRNFPRVSRATPWNPFAGSRLRFSPHYVGPHPLSEPESRAIATLAHELRPKVSVGFHSFGNMLLFPWAHTRKQNPRHARYEAVGRSFGRSLPRVPYRVMQATELYPTVGDLDDWLDATFGTLAFTVEVSRPRVGLLRPRRLLNPFCWMNPVDVDETVSNLTPALGTLAHAAMSAAA